MSIREVTEQWEARRLSAFACPAARSRGREREEIPCETRTCFQRDRDRIVHSKAFRRLQGKTQVYIAPEGDHFRTRLTHTLEVAQVARTLARSLDLNEDLTEAIALGHDLGHTPFGHIGERSLNELMAGGFRHNEQSRRVVERLERDGQGLNLTLEVRDGILHHSGNGFPMTMEGQCVRRADRIAYLNHDLDDALRGGILRPFEIPSDCLRVLGQTHSARINTMILDIVEHSRDTDTLQMSPTVEQAMDALRDFMFEHVYRDSWRAAEEVRCDHVIKTLFEYFCVHPAEMPEEFMVISYQEGTERGVCDYLSGMTDRYAIRLFLRLFVPEGFPAIK
ncbi:MAG: deoxyguanosinetriphosphate triphosphohydrolase [Clostridia bacterium]|nr:deoxyguanosinetriphosphate triphosphohydrolase [Clostridia bacterium]